MADIELVIKIPEELWEKVKDGYVPLGISKYLANGTPIPDNATNGQVIRTLFKPNRVERTDDDVIVENYDFNEELWNAPYQKGGKE